MLWEFFEGFYKWKVKFFIFYLIFPSPSRLTNGNQVLRELQPCRTLHRFGR
jgi:hypothetical protein